MTRRIERYDKDYARLFVGCPYATMDPGTQGYLLFFDGVSLLPKFGAPAFSPEAVLRVMAQQQVCPLVLEARFIHSLKTANSVMELCFTAGIVVGMLSMFPGKMTKADVLEVSPHTWQAWQTAREGVERGKGVGAAVALAVAERQLSKTIEWKRANKSLKTGIASAYGIAQWWQEQVSA